MNIVITGSTSGLGLAFVIKFLELGDKVVISSRSSERVNDIFSKLANKFGAENVLGIVCNVSKPEDILNLGRRSVEFLGSIDFWINNAGTTGSKNVHLIENTDDMLREIIETNLLGSLYGSREALKIFVKQNFGHLINIAGRGTNGGAAENLVAYASSKRSLDVLTQSLIKETNNRSICIHLISPGMVMTNLLLKENTPLRTKRVFNILAEHPTTVANHMVPKIRQLTKTGQDITFLTNKKAVLRFLTAFRFKNKFFNDQGTLITSIDPLDKLTML